MGSRAGSCSEPAGVRITAHLAAGSLCALSSGLLRELPEGPRRPPRSSSNSPREQVSGPTARTRGGLLIPYSPTSFISSNGSHSPDLYRSAIADELFLLLCFSSFFFFHLTKIRPSASAPPARAGCAITADRLDR